MNEVNVNDLGRSGCRTFFSCLENSHKRKPRSTSV